jgi:cell division septation protein DedD
VNSIKPPRSLARNLGVLALALCTVMFSTGVALAKKHELSDPSVSPRSGTVSTTFTLNVRWKHDGKKGESVWVMVGSSLRQMSVTCHDCGGKETWSYSGKFASGKHTVSFGAVEDDRLRDVISGGSITAGAAPKPTPKPKPDPKPKPKPHATPKPKPKPKPHATPKPRATAHSTPSPTPRRVTTPMPTPTRAPAPVLGGTATAGPQNGSTLKVARLDANTGVIALDSIRLAGGMEAYAWLVPGVALALPGLLVVLIIGGQIVLGTVFIPVTRRWLIGSRARKHSDRSTRSGPGMTRA